MNKVKCCYNCKYCHNLKFCTLKHINVEPDNKCDAHTQKDIMMEFEGD